MGKKLPIKVLLAGCDPEIQLRVAPALVRLAKQRPEQVQLAAVYGELAGHAETAASTFGFASSGTDLEQLFHTTAPQMVVCAMCSPQDLRQRVALLHRHLPTVIVPPLGRSLDDLLAMSEAARESSAVHMAAMTQRFSPYLCRAVQWARQLGEIRSVKAHYSRPGEIDSQLIWTGAVGALDAVFNILGRAEGFTYSTPEGASNRAAVEIKFANGCQGVLELAGRSDHTEESYDIIGDGYQTTVVLQSLGGPSMQCWRGPKIEVRITAGQDQAAVQYDGMFEALNAFVDALLSDARSSPTLDDLLPAFDMSQRIAAQLPRVAAA